MIEGEKREQNGNECVGMYIVLIRVVGIKFRAFIHDEKKNHTMTCDFDRKEKIKRTHKKAYRLKMIFAPSETEFNRSNTEKKEERHTNEQIRE